MLTSSNSKSGIHTGGEGLGQELGGDPREVGAELDEMKREQVLPPPKLGVPDCLCWYIVSMCACVRLS